MTMKNLLEFPLTQDVGDRTESPTLDQRVAEDRLIGHGLCAIWQTPWMAPVCIRDADGMSYRCRIALELEAGHWLELTRRRLEPLSIFAAENNSPDGWDRIRPDEHRWDSSSSPLGQTVLAVAVDAGSTVHVVLEGGLLWIDHQLGGICRFEALDPAQLDTKDRLQEHRLNQLVHLSTGKPLIPG